MRMIAGAAAALLAGCAPTEAEICNQRALAEVRPVGPPVDCVTIAAIRNTVVRDNSTIDFYMRNGAVLRNRLPISCPTLGFERRFSYRTSLPRLCSVDSITALGQSGSGPSCPLGRFQPIENPGR